MARIPAYPSMPSYPGGAAVPASPLVTGRVALWRAVRYDGSGSVYDESGNGHTAQLGSAAGSDANDPVLLQYTSARQGLYLPGVTGNYVSTPAAAPNKITGDFGFAVLLGPNAWVPGSLMSILGRWTTTGNQRCYSAELALDGKIALRFSPNGATPTTLASSSVLPTVGANELLWVGGVRNATTGLVRFFTAPPTSVPVWSALGASVSGAAGAMFDSATAPLEIGSFTGGTANLLAGRFYRAMLFNADSLDAAPVFDAPFDNPAVFAEPYATLTDQSAGSVTVAVNRTATGLKSTAFDRWGFLYGSTRYLTTPNSALLNFAATDPFTITGTLRFENAPSSIQYLVSNVISAAGGTPGVVVYLDTDRKLKFRIKDAAVTLTALTDAALTPGVLYRWSAVRTVGPDTIYLVINGAGQTPVADTTTATLANANALYVGRLVPSGTNVLEAMIGGISVHRVALSNADADRQAYELS